MADDWEKEYEADRRRMLLGGDASSMPSGPPAGPPAGPPDTSSFGRRRDNDDAFLEQQYLAHRAGPQTLAPLTHPSVAPARLAPRALDDVFGEPSSSSRALPRDPVVSSAVPPESRTREENDAAIAAHYSQYLHGDAPAAEAYAPEMAVDGPIPYNARAFPMETDSTDPRYRLPFAPLTPAQGKQLKEKFGRFVYFSTMVEVYFKGFFSPNLLPLLLICCPHCVYFADTETGEVVLGRSIHLLQEILLLEDQTVSLRLTGCPDVMFRLHHDRPKLISILRTLYAAAGKDFPVRTAEGEPNHSYRKAIKLVDRKAATWYPVEDPRTGLALVEIPETFQGAFGPLIPKIMHWFGGVNQFLKDWKGSLSTERRACWITATSLFLSATTGPQNDGRDIKRCIGVEYISKISVGQGGNIGIFTNSGPKQPPLGLCFDSLEIKDQILHILRNIFFFRTGGKCVAVEQARNFDKDVPVEREKDFKPELFIMKTRLDLYDLLRSPTQKK